MFLVNGKIEKIYFKLFELEGFVLKKSSLRGADHVK